MSLFFFKKILSKLNKFLKLFPTPSLLWAVKKIIFLNSLFFFEIILWNSFESFSFKVFKKLSIPGFPTTKIFLLSMPSLIKLFLLVKVGAKWISEKDVINLLFNSSG